MNNYSGTFSLTWSWVNLLLATTSCIVRVSLFSFMVPAHLYLPWSLSSTSFIMRDWSQGEKDGRLLMFRSIGFPTPTFSQDVVLGLNPAEKTQGRVTADPTAAYTMVLSLGGLMIPVDEKKGNKTTSVCFTREDQCGVFSAHLSQTELWWIAILSWCLWHKSSCRVPSLSLFPSQNFASRLRRFCFSPYTDGCSTSSSQKLL